MFVNPNNRLVKRVDEDGGKRRFFFFAISPNYNVTAFRSEFGPKVGSAKHQPSTIQGQQRRIPNTRER